MSKPDEYTAHLRAPNHAQLSKAVHGRDPYYRIRARRSFWRREFAKALALLIVFLAFVMAIFVIGEVIR